MPSSSKDEEAGETIGPTIRHSDANSDKDSSLISNARPRLPIHPDSGMSRRQAIVVGAESGLLFLTLGVTAWAAWAATRATQLMEQAFSLEAEPHLFLSQSDDDIELTSAGFRRRGELVDPFFDINNAGRSPTIILALYRRWAIGNDEELPSPILYPEKRPGIYKENYIPVGPGERFPFVKGRLDGLTFPIKKGTYIYFYGYIVLSDLSKRKYVRGYLPHL